MHDARPGAAMQVALFEACDDVSVRVAASVRVSVSVHVRLCVDVSLDIWGSFVRPRSVV